MFTFHKPKVYRSTQGCCICKAKSSSSRFTDSKKYELDCMECFQLDVPRQGEICNACVLLVKRFKRLPPDSARYWGHVVDARVGPGLKSMTKFKKRKEELLHQQQQHPQQSTATVSACGEKFGKIFKKTKASKLAVAECAGASSPRSHGSSDGVASPLNLSDTEEFSKDPVANLYCHEQLTDDVMIPAISVATGADVVGIKSRTATAAISFAAVPSSFGRVSRKSARPVKNRSRTVDSAAILDVSDWRPLRTCCGIVYEHLLYGAVLLNCEQWRRDQCAYHGRKPAVSLAVRDEVKVVEDEQTRVTKPAMIASAPPKALTTTNVTPAPSTTIISSAGRKIKLTTNAVQFLKKAAGVRSPAASAAVPIVVGKPSTAPSSTNLLGKIITIKTTGATKDTIALRSISAVETSSTNGHKFNDNSSDSGYDEAMMQEPNGKNSSAIVRPIILPNTAGIKLVQKLFVAGMPNTSNQVVIMPTEKPLAGSSKAAMYTIVSKSQQQPKTVTLPASCTLNAIAPTRTCRN